MRAIASLSVLVLFPALASPDARRTSREATALHPARVLLGPGSFPSVATGGEDNRIRIWSPDNDGRQVREIGGFGGIVFRLRYLPDGQTLVACGADKTVHVLKPTGSSLRKLPGHQDWIYALAVSRDGKTLASGSWDGDVRLWNLADGKLVRNFFAAPGYKPVGTQAAAR